MTRIVYVNGEYVPADEAKISVFDRGFLFADGIYEVSAVLDGHLVDSDSHMQRLERSLGEIQINPPCSYEEIVSIQRELIARNGLKEGLVYFQVTRGSDGDRDFPFPKDIKSTLVMFTKSTEVIESPYAKTGVKVCTVPDIRWARRDIKSVALLAQVLAKQEAKSKGCFEGWMVQDGAVTEGTSSTAYIIKGNKLITRPLSNDILPGCTRKAVLNLLSEANMELEERLFTPEEAYDADEAFLTSATTFVMPIVEIDGKQIGGGQPGPHARRLRELYIIAAKAQQ